MHLGPLGNFEEKCEILPMADFHREVYNLLMDSPPQVKHRIRSSIQGIMKAWGLKDIDSNMACFRIITAQEEAESAIIHSLKRRRYKDSAKLKPHNHIHKAAVFYIFQAFSEMLSPMSEFMQGEFLLEADGKTGKRVPKTRFRFKKQDDSKYYYPIPPLHVQITEDDGANKKIHDLEEQIAALASRKGKAEFVEYLQEDTNIRNEILYASEQGIPSILVDVGNFVKEKSKKIYALNIVCLFIDYYPQKQLLVQQLLDAMLKHLKSTVCPK